MHKFDLWAAQIVLDLRRKKRGLGIFGLGRKNDTPKLHCILPCEGQEDKWPRSSQERYRDILKQADSIVYVSREYDDQCMENSEKYEIYFLFPSDRSSKTVLALCGMKDKDGTAAPPRTVYVGPQLARELKAEKQRQDALRVLFGSDYEDYGIVIAQDMGRPYEEHDIRKQLKKLCTKNDLPVIVPHSMRHLSVTLKLLISGDVKAVQADSGHKDAEMVYNRYSHALDAERRKLALSVDEALYSAGAAG